MATVMKALRGSSTRWTTAKATSSTSATTSSSSSSCTVLRSLHTSTTSTTHTRHASLASFSSSSSSSSSLASATATTTPRSFLHTSTSPRHASSPRFSFTARPKRTTKAKAVLSTFYKVPEPSQPSGAHGVLRAERRTAVGSKNAEYLRVERNRVPCVIFEQSAPRKNDMMLSVMRLELEREIRRWGEQAFMTRVLDIQIEDADGKNETVPVICKQIDRHSVNGEPLTITFMRFRPDQRFRVDIPVRYQHEDESVGVRRGGCLLYLRDTVPCYWQGNTRIPAQVTVDLLNAELGRVVRSHDLAEFPGLRVYNSSVGHALCVIQGFNRQWAEEEKAKQDEEALKAAAAAASSTSGAAAGGAAAAKK